MSDTSARSFGGPWSDEKLDALRAYLSAYNTALSKTSFERIYIDAFAGAGMRDLKSNSEDQRFDDALAEEDATYRHGSPLIALGTEPSFARYIFIERDADSISKLRNQAETHFPAKLGSVDFLQGDANEVLQSLAKENWRSRRAVAFLDPFALHVKWKTIELIAKTQAIDMWLLFPAMAVNRMLPRSGDIPLKWEERLNESFGSNEWKSIFYQKGEPDLFGEEQVSKQKEFFARLSEFITGRLQTVFAGVHKKPLILRNSTGSPLFHFCFASGNPKGAPIALKIADYIIQKKTHGK